MNWRSGSATRAPLVFKLCMLVDLIFDQYKTCVQIIFWYSMEQEVAAT